MEVFDLVLEYLRVIVADVVDNLRSLLEDVGVRRVPDLKELVLLLHKHAIVEKGPSADEVQGVSRGLLLQSACQEVERQAKRDRQALVR